MSQGSSARAGAPRRKPPWLIVMQVRPADPARRQPQAQLPRPRSPRSARSSIRRSRAAWMTMAFPISPTVTAQASARAARRNARPDCRAAACPIALRVSNVPLSHDGVAAAHCGSGQKARVQLRLTLEHIKRRRPQRSGRFPSAASKRGSSSILAARLMLISIPSDPSACNHPGVDDVPRRSRCRQGHEQMVRPFRQRHRVGNKGPTLGPRFRGAWRNRRPSMPKPCNRRADCHADPPQPQHALPACPRPCG